MSMYFDSTVDKKEEVGSESGGPREEWITDPELE